MTILKRAVSAVGCLAGLGFLHYRDKQNIFPPLKILLFSPVKKYLPYLLVIAVFAGGIFWFSKSQTKESVTQREGDFAVKDGNITRIVLNDTEKKHIELTKQGDVWLVNGKYPAKEELIEQLLDAITRVTSLTPVPTAGHDNVLKAMMTENVKVQVFTADEKEPGKVYLVGGPTVDSRGTYMLLEVDGEMAGRPHITYIPGYYGYLTPRFSTDEENWRNKVMFKEGLEEIAKLTVDYPATPEKSFSVTKVAKDSFAVNPLDEKYRIQQTYEQKYVLQYLSFYSSIYLEAFNNGNPAKDSIIMTAPFCRINLQKEDGSTKAITLYYMPINKRTKAQVDPVTGEELFVDKEHYFAVVNEKDFAIVQYYVFGKLLRSYKDFYFKPTQ